MIASNVGKTFLNAYNQRQGTNYSARDFFIKKFFPLFYDHEKPMQWVHNSPFFQLMKEKGNPEKRRDALNSLLNSISQKQIGSSIAVGYYSADTVLATTSGQLTNIDFNWTEDDVFCSWFGDALGLNVLNVDNKSNTLTLLLNDEEFLLDIYEGWEKYRAFLEEVPKLIPNKINDWNTQWILHKVDPRYQNFDPLMTQDNKIIIKPVHWTQFVFMLTLRYPEEKKLIYLYNLDKTNTTIGFIPFDLPKVRRLIDLYKELFGENEYLKGASIIEKIYAKGNVFKQACEKGIIGLRVLEPTDLRLLTSKKIQYDASDYTQVVSFQTYKTWILAMLNNKELHELARQIASQLIAFEKTTKRAKSTKGRKVETLLSKSSVNSFFQELVEIIEEVPKEEISVFQKLVAEINNMSEDNFKRFVLLLKIEHAIKLKQE